MKHFYKGLLGLIIGMGVISCKKDNGITPEKISPVSGVYKAPANFRVVGYMYMEDATGKAGEDFDLSRINYLNIAFINPDESGKFSSLSRLAPIVAAAHDKNVKVMASLGGARAPAYMAAILSDDRRAAFINTLVQLAVENNIDGIDVDLEGNRIDKRYEAFIAGLSAGLKTKGKLLTAAIATWERDSFTDKSLTYFDFVNVMSYDKTGPWDPGHPGPHSPYEMAVNDLDYWTNTRGITKDRLNLGLPFYGYGFGNGVPVNINYSEVIKNYPGAENRDKETVAAGGSIYYNGIPTIEQKTNYALQNAGGVMIWELMADATGEKSLLTAIDKTANPSNN